MEKSTGELLQILKSKKTYEEFLKEEIGELYFSSIGEYLEMMLTKKKMKKSEAIEKSNLDKNYAYQIFNGNKKNPSRDKLIMLAIGMGMTIEETRKLLKLSGHSDLYIRSVRDAAIIFCIMNKKGIIETNEMLSDMSLDILQ